MWIGIPESLFLTKISVKGHKVVRGDRDCLVQQQLAWGGQEGIAAATESRDRTRVFAVQEEVVRMITNPSNCQGEGPKEEVAKFHSPGFEEGDLTDLGSGGQAGGLTELGSYSHYGHATGHGGHYGSHYGHYGGGGWQDYGGYYQGGQGQGQGQGGYYHYPQGYQQQDWPQGHMVLPPGPSPTGSNNSPSPHGFSDTGEPEPGHHVISRTELKRPSPDSFLPHPSLGPNPSLHHQSVPKKPKVSKRRKKRDPNEPQKPVSAYALFFRDTQASIKMRNPNANFGEVSKIVAATWDGLDPDSKAAYKKRTEMAKKEYLRALAAYRANMVSKVGKRQKCHKFLQTKI